MKLTLLKLFRRWLILESQITSQRKVWIFWQCLLHKYRQMYSQFCCLI